VRSIAHFKLTYVAFGKATQAVSSDYSARKNKRKSVVSRKAPAISPDENVAPNDGGIWCRLLSNS